MRAHLYGGGPGDQRAIAAFFREALADLSPNPLVAYVGVASDDDPGFAKRMVNVLEGARVEQVRLARASDSVASAFQLLADADAIFLSGGDVDHGMRILTERGAIGTLERAVADGKRLLGVSAGSILAGRGWVRFPDDDDSRAERFDCLELVPYSFDAHAEEDDWHELRTYIRLGKNGDEVGYGLPAAGGVVIDTARSTIRAWGEPVVRIGVRDGKVVTLSPLAV